jgi:hypothetical protein
MLNGLKPNARRRAIRPQTPVIPSAQREKEAGHVHQDLGLGFDHLRHSRRLVVSPGDVYRSGDESQSARQRLMGPPVPDRDNFTLSNFSGSIISLKRHHSARSAFRAGFSLSLSSGSSETDPSDTSLPVEIDNDDVGLLVDLQYVRYSNPAGRLSPYWAIGPRVGYAKQNLKSATGDDQVERYERRQWTVGVIGSLGAEWFPVRFIGLHAEYGLTLTYSSIKAEREDTPFTETQTGRVWTFEGDGVLLGLSVYF